MLDYSEWLPQWSLENPEKTPPTREQFEWLVEAIVLTSEELGIDKE